MHHEVIATHKGTHHIPCHLRTALLPDRCRHATDFALFSIANYEKYEKLGKYRDTQEL